jgi:signal-transduction protein with cAMP-binding, CBS, and nucleotidyltransferase domain
MGIMDLSMTPSEKIAFLTNVFLFQALEQSQLEKIANMAEVDDYSAGEYICQEGVIGDSMYLILEGSVSLEKDGMERVHLSSSRRLCRRDYTS